MTDFVLTKLDVLTGLETIPVCVAYEVDGERVDEVPVNQSDFHHAKPIYEEFPGWTEDITGARSFEDLPKTAQDYVLAVEAMSGARISAIGVGPGRDAIVVRHDLLGTGEGCRVTMRILFVCSGNICRSPLGAQCSRPGSARTPRRSRSSRPAPSPTTAP